MAEYTQALSGTIKTHLASLIKSSGLPENEESLETMAKVWWEKKKMFEGQIKALDMQEIHVFTPDDPRGALLLTYSGSLVSLSPSAQGGRRVEYASIQLRTDVPHLMVMERATLAGDAALDAEARFTGGAIQNTSALFKIAVCGPEVSPEEQEKRIREATIYLTNGFVKINRTLAPISGDLPEQFTTKAIVAYLARKNGLSQKQTRLLLDDYLTMLESGMLLGLRVPLGRVGRLFLRKRPARKARVGINPTTKEKITLKARPEEPVPKIVFSRLMKDRARQAEI
jgi:nucleoid DNA-binding protein